MPDSRRKQTRTKQKEAKTSQTVSEEARPQRPPRRVWRMLAITAVSLLGPLAAVALGLYVYMVGGRYVSTDNAYVKADKIAVSSDISSRVVDVAVSENQAVEAGDLLFRIDPEPFRIALERADARLTSARQDIEALRAERKQKLAELKLAKGDVEFYQRQFERQKNLNARGFSSESSLDTARKNLRNARDQTAMIAQAIAQVEARLGPPDRPVENHPAVLEAQAALDQAALDLRRTEVRASTAGIVTNFELQPGEYVESGETVFSLVGAGDVWVDANFKETDLTHVRPGQSATISVDTYPGEIFEATVSGISQATGAEFALLPPQNASGNWVKVVQRLPVRLRLKNAADGARLRAGMSTIVEIDTGHQRRLPGLADAALNWARSLI